MRLTTSRKAALIIGVGYIAAALSVAVQLRSPWDIVVLLVLCTAGNFLLILGLTQ